MYCKKCRNKINPGWRYCPHCQNILTNDTVGFDERKILEDKRREEKEAIIYVMLFLIGIAGSFLFGNGAYIFFLVSLISIVTGFIKCPNSLIIKILFWVFLICVILLFIAVVILTFTCMSLLVNCGKSV